LSDPDGADYSDLGGWTPDSSAVIVGTPGPRASWNGGGNSSQDAPRIDLVPVADGEPRTVIEEGFRPALSPDGSQIAYLRELPGAGDLREIWVASADGSDP
jgi:hypothetical protein